MKLEITADSESIGHVTLEDSDEGVRIGGDIIDPYVFQGSPVEAQGDALERVNERYQGKTIRIK